MITEPGIYDISAPEYHADPCPEPSLSSSILSELLAASPAHAREAHPRLNPDFVREEKEIFDRGTAAHAYLLQGEDGFEIISAPDWRTKAAQEARAIARLAGKVPLLEKHWNTVLEMTAAANRQLDAFRDPPRPFCAGKPERTIVWREGGIWCRARLDWLHDSLTVIDDYKSTGASAHPDAWTRGPLFAGADIQTAFYLRGLKAVTGNDARWRFVVQENFAPYALSVIALDPMVLALAEKKVRLGIELWGDCLSTGVWPAYPNRTCYAELPPWIEAQWLRREEQEPARPDRLNSLMGAAAMAGLR
jgi:hypothetical protein